MKPSGRITYLFIWSLFAGVFLRAQPVVQVAQVIVKEKALADNPTASTKVCFDSATPAVMQSMSAVSERVANFHINAGGANSFGDIFALRGLANTPYFSEPSVALYIDDIPLSSSFTYPVGLFGTASATVFRGPQGTAFGRGAEGGVIVLNSAMLGAHATGEFRTEFGNFNERASAISIRSARGISADTTVNASFNQRAGYLYNLQLGTRVNDQQAAAVSTRTRWRPTSTSEFTLQLLGTKHHDGAQPLVPLGGPLFSVRRGREGSTNVGFGAAALKGDFDTHVGRLTATTSYTAWSIDPYDNRLVLPPTLDSKVLQDQRTWNVELRLASGTRAASAWHAGAWWSENLTNSKVNRSLVISTPTNIPVESSNYNLTGRTFAVFGETAFAPTLNLRLIAGIRMEVASRAFDRRQSVPGSGQFVDSKDFDTIAPKFSASYTLGADMTVSTSVSLAAKPGGWSAYTGNAALAPFNTERVLAWEADVDTAMIEKSVKLTARVFDYEISNYQIERSFNATDYLVVNAARARSVGGEVEATWRPASKWTITESLGVTLVKLRRFTDPFTNKSYAGKRAPYVPDYNFDVGATWRPDRGWFATAELVATGKIFYDESESSTFAARARAVASARVGYETDHWRLTAFGANLGNANYVTLVIPGVRHVTPGAPFSYGAELTVLW